MWTFSRTVLCLCNFWALWTVSRDRTALCSWSIKIWVLLRDRTVLCSWSYWVSWIFCEFFPGKGQDCFVFVKLWSFSKDKTVYVCFFLKFLSLWSFTIDMTLLCRWKIHRVINVRYNILSDKINISFRIDKKIWKVWHCIYNCQHYSYAAWQHQLSHQAVWTQWILVTWNLIVHGSQKKHT